MNAGVSRQRLGLSATRHDTVWPLTERRGGTPGACQQGLLDQLGLVGPSRDHGQDGKVLEGYLLCPLVAGVRGHVPDAGERALRQKVQAVLTGLPGLTRLVARQMQPSLARGRSGRREH